MKKVLLLAVSASMISAALANLDTPSPSRCWAPRRPARAPEDHIPRGIGRRALFSNTETTPPEERIAAIMPRVASVIDFVKEKTACDFDPQLTTVEGVRTLLISSFPLEYLPELVTRARRVSHGLGAESIPVDANNQIALVHDWAQIRLVD